MPYKTLVDQRSYARKHYLLNRDAYQERARECDARVRAEGRRIVLEHLRANPCIDCGEADPVVLEFDHRDPATKRFEIGGAVRTRPVSVKRLLAEIAKCDVRCANCHRRRTAHQFAFYKTVQQ